MDCKQLTRWIETAHFPLDDAIAAHLEQCELCRERLQHQRLLLALRWDPVPPSSPDFEDRVIARVIERGRLQPGHRHQRWLAAAAVVCLAVTAMVTAWSTSQQQPSPTTAKVINVVIEARDHRKDALLTLELSDGLALDGFGEQRRIEWRTDLEKGRNLLALPLRVTRRSGGDLRLALSYDGRPETQMHVPVGT